MMYLFPEPVPIQSSTSRPSPYHHLEIPTPFLPAHTRSRRRYCPSDEGDDRRDRQSHWKRLKTCSYDHHGGNSRTLIRYSELDQERSLPHSTVQTPSRTNPLPYHRVIEQKGKEEDAGLRRCNSGSQKWDMAETMLLRGDGGAASSSQDICPMRRNESMMSGVGYAIRSSSPVMCEQNMVVREKHMARMAPAGKGLQVRVSGREALGSLEDSRRHADDGDDDIIPVRLGPNALNRRSGGGEIMNRAYGRGFGDHRSDVRLRARKVEFDLSVGNGKGRTSRYGNGESVGEEHGEGPWNHTATASGAVEAKERDMESERRQEKRERWAVKERDLEIEVENESSMPKTQSKASVTVVDYSHKFTVAKAPISSAAKPVELDPHRLCQRQKQIDYGKNTLSYERYTESVPRYQRTKGHPRTPDIRQVCSKRSWDGQIRKWRRLLHEYDPPKGEDEEDPDLIFAPTTDPDKSATEDRPMDTQPECVEDPDLKIYEGWSDDEC